MAKKIVGLIGSGTGPVVHVKANCSVQVQGLTGDGLVTLCIDGRENVVFDKDGIFKLPYWVNRLFFSADRVSRELICNVLVEN